MAKILIVDDEPRIRDLIREHLQYAGFTCEEAGDGTAALSVLSQGGIDLVILDIMMPFMDGMTCLREMRTRKIMTPVIMLTARSEEYDKLAGLESGADDYVVKPFSLAVLYAKAQALLRRATERLAAIDGLRIYGTAPGKCAIVSFNVEGVHPYDMGMILDKLGIAVRTGQHCAEPVMDHYATTGMCRASFALYNTQAEADALADGVERAVRMLR